MKYLAAILLLTQILCCSVQQKTIYKKASLNDKIDNITLLGNEEFEYFINADMMNNDTNFHYTINFLQSGKIIYAMRYESKYSNPDSITLASERSKRFLVTDSSSGAEPTYFGNSTTGLYDTLVWNNYLGKPNLEKSINNVSSDEKNLFHVIDSLSGIKNFKINKIDSTVIGWFRYDF